MAGRAAQLLLALLVALIFAVSTRAAADSLCVVTTTIDSARSPITLTGTVTKPISARIVQGAQDPQAHVSGEIYVAFTTPPGA